MTLHDMTLHACRELARDMEVGGYKLPKVVRGSLLCHMQRLCGPVHIRPWKP
jgi:hypothetical protein